MELNFYPERDDRALAVAAAEYERIWGEDGPAFLKALKGKTGLSFVEGELNALVYEGISRSHPLILRASYSSDVKAAVLVHELGHRLLAGNSVIPEPGEDFHLNAHKLLDLFLFDVYLELFGEQRAQEAVAWESGLRESYRDAWRWALEFSEAGRAKRFATLLSYSRDGSASLSRWLND